MLYLFYLATNLIFMPFLDYVYRSWHLNWNAFANADHNKLIIEQETLPANLTATWLSMPLALYRRGFITTGLQLCGFLSFNHNTTPRYFVYR